MKTFMFPVFLSLALVGCAHGEKTAKAPKEANPAEVERVRQRAMAELSCQEVTVEVLEAGGAMRPWTFIAKGCDKTATYLSRMGTILRN